MARLSQLHDVADHLERGLAVRADVELSTHYSYRTERRRGRESNPRYDAPMLLTLLTPALAGEWARQPVEPKLPYDFNAYPLGRWRGRVGVFDQEVGVWDNVDVGTTAPLFLIGVPNAHAKVTAIQAPRVDASFDAGWLAYDLEKRLGVPGGELRVVPLGWTVSAVVTPKLSLHGGTGWILADARGEIGVDQLAEGLAAALGADLGDELAASLADAGGIYAGAHLSITQLRLAADYRLNRRDALVLQSNSFLLLRGTLSGGYASEGGVEVGATANIEKPLTDQLQSVITVSWQFSWEHLDLRVGLPVPTRTLPLYWVAQAFELSYRF